MKKKFIPYQTIIEKMKDTKSRRRRLLMFSLCALALSLTGCKNKSNGFEDNTENQSIVEDTQVNNTITPALDNEKDSSLEPTENNNTENIDGKGLTFKELSKLQFVYSSGAGAWATLLNVNEDGTFQGVYSDSDMGDMGESFPNGTNYNSVFKGKFSQPKFVNEYTDSITIEWITLEKEVGTEEIVDGIKYVYSTPYGLSDAKELYLYHKDTPIKDLPEEFLSWVGYMNPEEKKDETLPFIGLYNVNTQSGFSSYDILIEEGDLIKEPLNLADVEHNSKIMEERITSEEMTQLEYNNLSGKLYQLWDNELNRLWKVLKETLNAEQMSTLLKEQRNWIKFKEQEVEAEGSQYAGGTMQSMVESMKAADMTKKRVYELYKLLNE